MEVDTILSKKWSNLQVPTDKAIDKILLTSCHWEHRTPCSVCFFCSKFVIHLHCSCISLKLKVYLSEHIRVRCWICCRFWRGQKCPSDPRHTSSSIIWYWFLAFLGNLAPFLPGVIAIVEFPASRCDRSQGILTSIRPNLRCKLKRFSFLRQQRWLENISCAG